jgi:hypothetical protein
MKIVVDHPILSEALKRWHVYHTAEGLRSAEPEIIEQDHNHVGCARRRFNLEQRRRGGFAHVDFSDGRISWFL